MGKIKNLLRKIKNKVKNKLFKRPEREKNIYEIWMGGHQASQEELEQQRKTKFPYEPRISIVVPVYNTPLKYLYALIESVKMQTYANWELCISDGSGKRFSKLAIVLKLFEMTNKRIHVVVNRVPLQISKNTNQAIRIAQGNFIAFADHDDLLAPDALFECIKALNENSEIDVIYTDEDKMSMDGQEFFNPHFKTDFNIDLLRSMNYICHFVVVSKRIIEQVGMLREEFDGAQDYDFILRSVEAASYVYHIPKALYHWRVHNNSTAENPESKLYAFEVGARAVQAHYDRVGIAAIVHQGEYPGIYRTEYIIKEHPLISIIIANKDHIEDLDKCIKSIEQKSSYENYECIIIENNSEDPETFSYYKELEERNSKIRVVYWEGEFNYSAINNYGITYANGEYLLLLNNDAEIINQNCLEELLGYCMREDVGAVGARLYYNDDTIQHAGVIVGFGGVAGHAFLGLSKNDRGYFSRVMCAQNLSAVTAACVMMKKKVFEEVGGLDETLKVAFNDVDLCMKIRQAGYLIVYNPYAELYHYESKSRGADDTEEKMERAQNEIHVFVHKWSDFLKKGDPYYSPNLSVDRGDFTLI